MTKPLSAVDWMPCRWCGLDFLPVLGRSCDCLNHAPAEEVTWKQTEDDTPAVFFLCAGKGIELESQRGDENRFHVEFRVGGGRPRMTLSRNQARHMHILLGELLDKLEAMEQAESEDE